MTGAGGVRMTGAGGVLMNGAIGLPMTGAGGLPMTGAGGLLMTGAGGLLMTGAGGLLMTGTVDLLQTGAGDLLLTGARDLLLTGGKGLLLTGGRGLPQIGAKGLLLTGASSLLLTGVRGLPLTRDRRLTWFLLSLLIGSSGTLSTGVMRSVQTAVTLPLWTGTKRSPLKDVGRILLAVVQELPPTADVDSLLGLTAIDWSLTATNELVLSETGAVEVSVDNSSLTAETRDSLTTNGDCL